MFGLCFGSFMYADDLILIAPSVNELQIMLNICCKELSNIDLVLNELKSVCMRIGKRCHFKCSPLLTQSGSINWSDSVVYLGVKFVSAVKFKCDMEKAKPKFYSSFNSIYSKIGKINNPMVTLKLISSISLPSLLYAMEALTFSKTDCKSLENPWNRVFMKIFGTFNLQIVRQCQYFVGLLPAAHILNLKKISFIDSLKISPRWRMKCLHEFFSDEKLKPIAHAYGTQVSDLVSNAKVIVNKKICEQYKPRNINFVM